MRFDNRTRLISADFQQFSESAHLQSNTKKPSRLDITHNSIILKTITADEVFDIFPSAGFIDNMLSEVHGVHVKVNHSTASQDVLRMSDFK